MELHTSMGSLIVLHFWESIVWIKTVWTIFCNSFLETTHDDIVELGTTKSFVFWSKVGVINANLYFDTFSTWNIMYLGTKVDRFYLV